MKPAILALFLVLIVPIIVVYKKINEHDAILENRLKDRTGIR
ncbi:hypothetical protein [Alkalihalobacillus sp. CinArs1]|nr:hypothetical protein [Alkalihalobacillus sp. CinArs1]